MGRFKRVFFTIFRREWKRLSTTSDLLLICFLAPLVYGVVLSSIYWDRRVDHVPIGVIDRDNSGVSRTLVRWLGATQNVTVTGRYLDTRPALDDMLSGEISGLLYVPAGFSSDLKSGKQAHLVASVNTANIVVANPVMTSFAETVGTLSSGLSAKTKLNWPVPSKNLTNSKLSSPTPVLFLQSLVSAADFPPWPFGRSSLLSWWVLSF